MTKQDIINQMADITGLKKSQCEDALSAVGTVISTELKCGNEITLPNIGKFSVTSRAAREGRNPATGEKMHIPAKNGVSFKAVKALKDIIA
jgi:DNA-binding protein HU-beta